METYLETGFAQNFPCSPKILSCPKFGGAAAPQPPRPPDPYAGLSMCVMVIQLSPQSAQFSGNILFLANTDIMKYIKKDHVIVGVTAGAPWYRKLRLVHACAACEEVEASTRF